jgi:GntR family transcriptional repressor for pyruvate dehydrogenase complex
MAFQEIGAVKKKSTLVAEQIIQSIRNKEYQEGDRLPPEREIAEQMKVSRTCVREALSALQILGIIESRSGDGTYVSSTWGKINIELALPILEETKTLFEVWEARRELETCLAKLAIERGSSEDLSEIECALDEMKRSLERKDYSGYLEANERFHIAIAQAARNMPLAKAFKALLRITAQQLLEKVNQSYVVKYLEYSFSKHQRIFQAIKNRDYDNAIAAISDHFDDLIAYFAKDYLKKDVPSYIENSINSAIHNLTKEKI